jgi:transcriptional regulator with XRE-family HTH domain
VNRKQIRLAAGVSRMTVAAAAGVSLASVALYEADPDAISSIPKRAALARIYADLQARLANSEPNRAA